MSTNIENHPDREALERQIQDQLAKARDLLQEVAKLETASSQTAAESDESKMRQTAEREYFRSVFSSMLDEVTALQGTAERLARKLVDVIEDIERTLGPDPEFPSLPINPTVSESVNTSQSEDSELKPTPVAMPVDLIEEDSTSTVLVHGLDSASKALAFKRFVEVLPNVSKVSTHEFAAGVLRLNVISEGTLSAPNIAAWDEAGRLEVVRTAPGLIEVAL